ncbi:MAG: tol-pal system protein YbgF [Enterobacterales bacterium]|nr:tol-pal system protein YbgF [Enterobacterales bacterium]
MMQYRSFVSNGSLKKAMTSVIAFLVLSSTIVISGDVYAESNQTLQQQLLQLEALNQNQSRTIAELTLQVNELQREVRNLNGQVEDNSYQLKQIQDRQRELYRDIEQRLAGLSRTGGEVASKSTTAKKIPASSHKSVSRAGNGVDEVSARKDFEAAFALVRNKDYLSAIKAFEIFLQNYPSSSYGANARFWMGQVYFVQSNLKDAELQFKLLLADFPESSKANGAKLKLADIYLKQKLWPQARERYQEVVDTASGAQQQLARKGLDKIKKAGH